MRNKRNTSASLTDRILVVLAQGMNRQYHVVKPPDMIEPQSCRYATELSLRLLATMVEDGGHKMVRRSDDMTAQRSQPKDSSEKNPSSQNSSAKVIAHCRTHSQVPGTNPLSPESGRTDEDERQAKLCPHKTRADEVSEYLDRWPHVPLHASHGGVSQSLPRRPPRNPGASAAVSWISDALRQWRWPASESPERWLSSGVDASSLSKNGNVGIDASGRPALCTAF